MRIEKESPVYTKTIAAALIGTAIGTLLYGFTAKEERSVYAAIDTIALITGLYFSSKN